MVNKVGRPQLRIPDDLRTPAEICHVLGISRSGLQGMVERGRIPHYRLGSKVWFSEKAVIADMRRQASERVTDRFRKIPTPLLFEELKRRQSHENQEIT